jgi:hypothetical protein
LALAAPNDHLSASPHSRVIDSVFRGISGTGNCPTVRVGIVSAARTLESATAPNDHLIAGPHSSMVESGTGRVDGVRGCPTVRANVVSATGVREKPVL